MEPSAVNQAERANQEMVDRLITQGALWSPPLIGAFRATPRHRFLDRLFQYQHKHNRWREVLTRDPGPEELRLLYADRALITRLSPSGRASPGVPISSSSQPSLMAQMLEDMKLASGQATLEIGAGTGYNAALLAHVVAPGMVTSVDVDKHVLSEAWDHLRSFPERRVALQHADGRCGFAEAAPFDRIMVTAATSDLEPAWLEQLHDGGLLVAPVAFAPGLAYVVRGTVSAGVFQGGLTRAAYFMPLRAENETGSSAADLPPSSGPFTTIRAPWASWFERRRPRVGWLGFSQALAFHGLLRGLSVSFQTLVDGQPAFGVSDPEKGAFCWLGNQSWHINGDAGREVGWTLWRAFLDAGGPWPTEFRVRAVPLGREQQPALVPAAARVCHLRYGPRCLQRWELIEPRDRQAWI